ncbi:hypothetical protein DYB26_011963 [Aphanomyces astaci]|uniref:U2A'/phosphoprotein 32 family A C-terminal domain-containing protein n=1 Tax=Aphanomyces astaci TaxID=112090 RepID=A0A418FRB8_APHAT|nr:hypothetical protein DYB26_011963 [Aphanomyces astaci]
MSSDDEDAGSDNGGDDKQSSLLKAFFSKYEVDVDDDDDEAVEEIDLSEKQLTKVPGELCVIPQLQESLRTLCLEKNQLKGLPDAIGLLHNLHELYLRENELESLPAALAKLTHLDSLYLEDNALSESGFPNEIHALARLKGLCLQRNKLTVASIPSKSLHPSRPVVI